MFELRDADLRFRQNEVNQFLTTTMGLFLSEEEVMLLEQRTEGWIAGLQLAALALQQRKDHLAFVQTFTGNQRYLFDYIQEEILAHLEASVQDFLLQTSVLTRLHADLCQALIETLDVPSCQELLERLERANLFLIPLDEERGWYRFHDLFREALLTRLHATQPARLAQLHQHAAHWYEQHGEIREAIVHLLAAQDFSSAATLMERVAEEFWLRGEIQLLHYWIMALPNGVIREHARFVLTAALYLINTSAHTVEMQVRRTCKQAENMIERVEEAALLTDRWCVQEQPHENDVLPAPEVALLRRRVRLLRLWSKANEAEMNDDWEQHLSIDRQLQQEEQEDEILWQMISLSAAFIDAFSFQGKGARLLPKLVEARQQADRSGNRFVILKVRQWVALTSLQAGQIRQAYQQSREALELLEQMEGDVLLAGYFFFCQAIALYHWNRLAEARSVLQKMIHDATIWQRVDLLRCGYIILAELAMAAEDMLAAAQALHEVERLQHHGSLTPFDQSWSMIVRVRWWLARGDLTEARNWAERVLFQSDSWGANALLEFPMLLRIHGAQKQWAQARELLSRFSGDLDRSEDIQDLLPFLACSFVTLHHSGEGKQARTVATRLLALTAPEGHLRVFLDEGEPMRQALLALLTTPQGDEAGLSPVLLAYVSHVLAAFEQEEQQRKLPLGSPSLKTEKDLSHTAQPIASTSERVEPLSVREVEVLQLLSTGASNQAIADQLVISLTTAKKHVSHVLMKLGVENRTQAVVRARELSLL